MNKIKVGDVVSYVHRACSLRTSKIRSIQIINIQKELQEVNEHDLDAHNQEGVVYFEDGCSCHFNQIVSVLGGVTMLVRKNSSASLSFLGPKRCENTRMPSIIIQNGMCQVFAIAVP